MTMPPSGIDGLMDEQAVIEAEIYQELENINLDDEVLPEIEEPPEPEDDGFPIHDELDDYIKRLQDQSNRFEAELEECDELLEHNSQIKDENVSNALIPYEDHDLLAQLAREHGCDVEEYRRKILEDIENDEIIIEDELGDLIDDDTDVINDDNDGTGVNDDDNKLPVQIGKAVEEGVDTEETPVSQALVAVNNIGTSHKKQIEMQQILKDELIRVESRFEDRLEKMKKDDEFRKDEENLRQKRVMEERQWKKEEIQRQEKQMMFDREMAEREALKAQEELEKEMTEKMKQFEIEMATLQAENEKLRREYELEIEMEREKFAEKQDNAVRWIQRVFRGYRVRKEVGPELSAQREIRRKHREEERIKELEVVIENRKIEQQQKEELERQKKEEEKRQKEEEKRKREEEKKKLEEEKKQKKLEEERIKQEEKKRKEEEKQRKKEEEKQRKEEEKRKKEEQKRLKEEEDKRRKEEQKRLKEEEEQRKKEEQKKKEEEERQRKEEAIRMKEEEKRKQEEEKRNLDAEKKLKEENMMMEQEKIENKEDGKKENETKDEEVTKNDKDAVNSNLVEKQSEINQEEEVSIIEKNDAAQSDINDTNTNNTMSEVTIRDCPENIGEGDFVKMAEVGSEKVSVKMEEKVAKQENSQRSETPRSARRPKSARSKPSTPRREKKDAKEPKSNDLKKTEMNTDCLPKNLETLRLKFIEDCIPWSKVSNEPWKLKAGLSRKPLRQPSSAKKLPSLPEDLIIQSAKVASLKMVTTVELKDLPGNNISTLGQCGGLKYLTLNNCNLVALDGLSQCRQLQYIDVQGNKIEYVDLKDLGQLQYLNLSHNKLSSIHGLDSCTNVRWLDLSHNNITRLGGMDTLRRLFCLKLSHCQLISTHGLGATPTLQMLDISSNHLQTVEDLDKLCLLLSLNASANNILQVPNLKNQVLLTDLNLSNNSLSSLSGIGSVWLPLLCSLDLEQNSLTDLSSLQNCLLLKKLNLDENQVTDVGIVLKCVDQCFYMEELTVLDNPVETDINDSFYSKLRASCPRVNTVKDGSVSTKPRTSMEAMCLTQQSSLTEAFSQFEKNLRINGEQLNQANICDDYYKFCDRVFNMSVEYRYTHEYGEVTFIPSAPTAPKSGRPLSSRQREKFSNPKDMFENALRSSSDTHSMEKNSISPQNVNRNQVINDPKDLFEKALNGQSSVNQVAEPKRSHSGKSERSANTSKDAQSSYANPRDLFEQALKSADSTSSRYQLTNGHNSNSIKPNTRGDKYADAAVCIQSAWRGYACRKSLHSYKNSRQIDIDPALVERVYNSAVIIQATWRGYILRKKLLAALEYAQCDFDDDVEDPDMMDFGDEFDFEKFVDVDQDLLDSDWRPPSTPDIPNSYAVLRKPPSGKPRVPPINMSEVHPPSNPRRAWRNVESPLSDLGGKVPRPPSSLASTELTMRSVASRKEEKMAEEWGFKDSNTAHLMMQRAKKMKLNADKRKKLSKLDPKQRLALFRKLEEVTHPVQPTVKQSRKTLPRKEYFQARQEEFVRQEREKHQEYQVKASRTFEWLHSQVGDHVVTDSVINQGFTEGPKYVPMDHNLPELIGGGKRIHLVSSPMSVELQSVDSVSTTGQKPRRFSAGSGSSTSKLPPIQPTSAPAPHAKERMSFRNAPTNQSVGWGGGKKRGNYM